MDQRAAITDLKRRLADAEAALRHADERTTAAVEPAEVRLNAFLVRFQERVRGYLDPTAVATAACRLLAEELGVNRVYWSEVDWTTCEFVIGADYTSSDAEPISGRFPLDTWEPFSSYHLEGRPVVVGDTATDPRVTPAMLQGYEALGIQADLAVPVLARDKLRSVLAVNQSAPRTWKPTEVALVQRAADWCWAEVERARAEASLRESKDRQAFLLTLSDALRPLATVSDIRATACRLLGQHLGADRTYYVEYLPREGLGVVADDYLVSGLPSLAGRYPFEAFRATYERIGNGATWIVPDVGADVELPAHEREFYAAQRVRASVNVPLAKAGVLEAAFCVVQTTARAWTTAQIGIVEDTAERLWSAIQRGRAEAELRESEERFRQFANAAAEGAWIRNAETLDMEYASPVASRIYGVEPQALYGGVQHWAGLILPEDRDGALARLEEARRGGVVVHEFRIQRPSDGAFRWIRSADFPLFDGQGGVQRVGGLAEDVTEAKLAIEHQGVLLAELQHRVRNIMALLRSITNRTGERAETVSDYRSLMMGRLLAFARVQALLTRTANVSVGIASLVHDEVSVHAQHDSQFVIGGPDITLSPKAAEVLTLAIHELATNAVKYGALSVPDGRVTVLWSTFEKRGGPWLAFDWTEEGAPARPALAPGTLRRRGFGSELIEGRIPYELRGRGQITIEPGGARCHLEFPLQEGASILETGAPQGATVFGGAIDMTGEPNLDGRRILVVEDDYYLATDTTRALRGAGAEVIGLCATEVDARAELEEQRPDAAVVDINLGHGPSFKLAERLKDRGVPFVFTTGYDAEVIPAEFEHVERLEKPLQLRQIIGAVARLTSPAT